MAEVQSRSVDDGVWGFRENLASACCKRFSVQSGIGHLAFQTSLQVPASDLCMNRVVPLLGLGW